VTSAACSNYNLLKYTSASEEASGPSMISNHRFAPATCNYPPYKKNTRHDQGWSTSTNSNNVIRNRSRSSFPFPLVNNHVYHNESRRSQRAASRNPGQSMESAMEKFLRGMYKEVDPLSPEDLHILQVPLVPSGPKLLQWLQQVKKSSSLRQ
jgi:hypothetical protein